MKEAAQRAIGQPELHANGLVIGPGDVAQRQRQPVLFRKRTEQREHALTDFLTLGVGVRAWRGR